MPWQYIRWPELFKTPKNSSQLKIFTEISTNQYTRVGIVGMWFWGIQKHKLEICYLVFFRFRSRQAIWLVDISANILSWKEFLGVLNRASHPLYCHVIDDPLTRHRRVVCRPDERSSFGWIFDFFKRIIVFKWVRIWVPGLQHLRKRLFSVDYDPNQKCTRQIFENMFQENFGSIFRKNQWNFDDFWNFMNFDPT